VQWRDEPSSAAAVATTGPGSYSNGVRTIVIRAVFAPRRTTCRVKSSSYAGCTTAM
jgi:hypothetical protein